RRDRQELRQRRVRPLLAPRYDGARARRARARPRVRAPGRSAPRRRLPRLRRRPAHDFLRSLRRARYTRTMALFRKEKEEIAAPPPPPNARRAPPGPLRRERRALLNAREERLRDLGGLTVEMYRRGSWRD